MMEVKVDLRLINRARYNMKVKKLCRKMAECMTEEDMMGCIETTAEVLRLLPDHLKEGLIDKMTQVVDEMGEKHGM